MTMVEVLVSIVVLAIVIAPTFDAMVRGRLLVMHRGEERAALRLVERKAEQLLAAGYNSQGSDADVSSVSLAAGTHPINSAILLISRGDTDSSNDVIGDLTWTVNVVTWVDPSGGSDDTEYKSVDIKLAWPRGAHRDSLVINTIVG
jgi:hypothetical protein